MCACFVTQTKKSHFNSASLFRLHIAGQPQRRDSHCVLHHARPYKQLQCGDSERPSSEEAAVVSEEDGPFAGTVEPFWTECLTSLVFFFDRDTAQTVKERFGKKLYESLLV